MSLVWLVSTGTMQGKTRTYSVMFIIRKLQTACRIACRDRESMCHYTSYTPSPSKWTVSRTSWRMGKSAGPEVSGRATSRLYNDGKLIIMASRYRLQHATTFETFHFGQEMVCQALCQLICIDCCRCDTILLRLSTVPKNKTVRAHVLNHRVSCDTAQHAFRSVADVGLLSLRPQYPEVKAFHLST